MIIGCKHGNLTPKDLNSSIAAKCQLTNESTHVWIFSLVTFFVKSVMQLSTMLSPSPPKRALHQAHALSMSTSGWPRSAVKGKQQSIFTNAHAESWAWEEPTAHEKSHHAGRLEHWVPYSWDTAGLTCGLWFLLLPACLDFWGLEAESTSLCRESFSGSAGVHSILALLHIWNLPGIQLSTTQQSKSAKSYRACSKVHSLLDLQQRGFLFVTVSHQAVPHRFYRFCL